jgi:hypothetical protein
VIDNPVSVEKYEEPEFAGQRAELEFPSQYRARNRAKHILKTPLTWVLTIEDDLHGHGERVAQFRVSGNAARMTSRQRALHGIFSCLGFFPPEFRERCYRWGAGLGILFGDHKNDSPETRETLQRLEGFILDLVLSAGTSSLSASARERWFSGLVADSEHIDPVAVSQIRKHARGGQ